MGVLYKAMQRKPTGLPAMVVGSAKNLSFPLLHADDPVLITDRKIGLDGRGGWTLSQKNGHRRITNNFGGSG